MNTREVSIESLESDDYLHECAQFHERADALDCLETWFPSERLEVAETVQMHRVAVFRSRDSAARELRC